MREYLRNLIGIGPEMSGRVPLNKVFFYSTVDSRLFLHINTRLVPAADLSPTKFKGFFIDAFQQLAVQLQTNGNLGNIKTITARSWIVRDHPQMFTRLGFIVDPKTPDWAIISTQDFLKRTQNSPS